MHRPVIWRSMSVDANFINESSCLNRSICLSYSQWEADNSLLHVLVGQPGHQWNYHLSTKVLQNPITLGYNTELYYMANPVFGKSPCSDWFFLGQDFAVRTVSVETIQPVYFCFEAKPANSKFETKSKVWILSFFTLKLLEEAKKKFQRWMEKMNILKCKPPEVHFTVRNRVPYNKQTY